MTSAPGTFYGIFTTLLQPMHLHAAELPGILVSEKAISEHFCPFTGRTGRRSFFATLTSGHCGRSRPVLGATGA